MFNFFKKLKGIELCSPLTGNAVALSEVPDAVFAEKMVGDGIAIRPTSNKVVAPCDGKVVQIFPTNHAVGIEVEGGIDLLIHVGIDTVELKGEGFTRLVEEGTDVKKGQPILEIDFDKINELGKPTITPFIVTNMDQVEIKSMHQGPVTAGETVVMTVKVNK
ncbi:MAG: PTS sugar transporter subunit IIA [Cellulosilyticaceae bacterium]